MTDHTIEQLNAIIRAKYNTLDDRKTICISPAFLAAEVYAEIDPTRKSPALVQVAAILELRQLARAVCRQWYAESERQAEQGNLFDFQLQPRYPAARTIDGEEEDVYVLRGYLTYKERQRNIERLRREAEAKMVHADALQAETDLLIRSGKLSAAKEEQDEPSHDLTGLSR